MAGTDRTRRTASEARRGWPRVAFALAAAGLLALLVWWLREPREATLPAETLPIERRGARLAARLANPRPPDITAPRAVRQTVTAESDAQEQPSGETLTETRPTAAVANLAANAAAEYRRRAQYPPWSLPLEPDSDDPILRDREVTQNIARGAHGEDPALVCFPDQVSFEAPEDVTLYAYLRAAAELVPAQRIEGEVRDSRSNLVAQLVFADSAAEGDAEAGDRIYTARLAGAALGAGSGAYAVRVHAVAQDGTERFGTSGFLYSRPDAQLTGRYSDRVSGGNLNVAVEIDVTQPGRFHLQASLYSASGQPLAWAQSAAQLEPGLRTIELTFFGRILRQKNIDGPYLLRLVALSTTTRMPNAKNKLVENAHTTRPYRADEFSEAPFNDPHLLDAAARLEGAAAAPQ